MSQTKSFAAAGDFYMGLNNPGMNGRWAIQVISTSQTITPQITADGTNWVTRAVTPADNSADVITITAAGLWIMDALACEARLHITGAGASVVTVNGVVG